MITARFAPQAWCIAIVSAVLFGACGGETARPYVAEIESFRAERSERLEAEYGWLSLVGLHWLEEGQNRFGGDPTNEIVLPPDAAPRFAGSFHYDDGVVRMLAAPETEMTHEGNPVSEWSLDEGSPASSEPLRLGRLALAVIRRGERHAIRVRDPESPVRVGFTGLEFFPIDPDYRVTARFVPYAEPREVRIPTVIGTDTDFLVPGVVEFELKGRTLVLQPLISSPEDTSYFFIIKDQTSGEETYAAGRYLSAERTAGETILDFNRAYNPPCVFTPYATCPLPPPENRMPIRVEAGEKVYGAH